MHNRFSSSPETGEGYTATGRAERQAARPHKGKEKVEENNARREELRKKGWIIVSDITWRVAYAFKFSYDQLAKYATKFIRWMASRKKQPSEPWVEKVGNQTWIDPEHAGLLERLLRIFLKRKKK